MTAVNHHAHLLFQKIISPTSHTSRTSGWRMQNSQVINELTKLLDKPGVGGEEMGMRHSRI